MVKINQITPNLSETQETQETQNIPSSLFETQETNHEPYQFFSSIKFCIILLLSLLVISSILVLSLVWMSSLLPNAIKGTIGQREAQFSDIVSSVTKSVVEATISLDVMKGQLLYLLDFQNSKQIEQVTYQSFLSEWKMRKEFVVTVYIGEPSGNALGIFYSGTSVNWLNMSLVAQYFYECDSDLEKYPYCKRRLDNQPTSVIPAVDLSDLTDSCNANPNQLVFSRSYVDVTTPNIDTFFTLLYCYSFNKSKDNSFDYYLGFDMTVSGFSDILISKIGSIDGSRSFIFETDKQYFVAEINSDSSVKRNTIFTIKDDKINQLSHRILEETRNNFKSLPCNNAITIEHLDDFVYINRFCAETGVDWIFVLSIPQWNFIGSLVIGLIVSIIGTCLIICIAVSLSIFVSVKIVKPFHNLIEQFQAVSRMDMESLDIKTSKFSEVRTLQKQFVQMTNQIRLFRSFIPQHLLNQVEKMEIMKKSRDLKVSAEHDSVAVNPSLMDSMRTSIRSTVNLFKGQLTSKQLFSLYLDKKHVTIVCVLIDEFSELISQMPPSESIHLLTDIFDQLTCVTKIQGGLLGHFENDSISITFNTAANHPKHQEKGVQAARSIIEKLKITRDKKWLMASNKLIRNDSFKNLIENIRFRVAVTTQEVLCGNIGTNDVKNFTLITNARWSLSKMLQLTKYYNLEILISSEVHKAVEILYHTRFIAEIQSLMVDEYSSLLPHSSELLENDLTLKFEQKVYELGDSTQHAADEWLYELREQERKQKWKIYNEACSLFFKNDIEKALTLFETFKRDNPEDIVVKQMVSHCKEILGIY
ncbi:adenylate/guanylate cyclase [Naegleria gruberi]|uniref:Adenylate/guanylate cyclase n=1 Tax=Naegleria gruberi TaxID=5762 RepID=D2VR72_NAEGR|nr:adenylate/guanylate cyclase [Naegleria gruberi]EFC40623.1 adenylate/guanylate cyclase [Naegleria gruberi]|eukprot:XP_002673367.1 adenylate/guanylate cyclase [Naegleria gruberi strain NEG-M]